MSRIKVDALQGTSGTDTAITLSGANATVGGTLAVTGVHTIGNNAIYTSDAGGVTQNTVQSLIKAWIKFSGQAASIHGSFNISSLTDNTTGDYSPNFTNNMNTSNNFAATTAGQDTNTRTNVHFSFEAQSASDIDIQYYEGGSKADSVRVASIISGDLA